MYERPEQPLRDLALAEPLLERARLMTPDPPDPAAPNGIKLIRIEGLDPVAGVARADVHFYSPNYLDGADSILALAQPSVVFRVSGGVRIRAGAATGQVRVVSVSPVAGQPRVLRIEIAPIGDYSTYTLSLTTPTGSPWTFDPLFAEIAFKFRPGCFNNNCAPEWESSPEPRPEPLIDYLAKDYVSFRETMFEAMAARVPDWQATSEADLDVVLAEIFAVAADELSDFQDRVMNEAFITTARKRVSLARHARLMDYYIHEGSQASTLLALEIEHPAGKKDFLISEGLETWTGDNVGAVAAGPGDNAVVFRTRHGAPQTVHQYLNNIGLYTWSNSITSLRAGATRADLALFNVLYLNGPEAIEPADDEQAAIDVAKLINDGIISRLIIEEHRNPETGLTAGLNPEKRQLLHLIAGAAEALKDNIADKWFVRIRWEKTDALRHDYCFRVECPTNVSGFASGPIEHVSLFHGNIVEAFHGRRAETWFLDETEQLDFSNPDQPLQFHFERTRWGAVCALPGDPLAYRQTPAGGDVPPHSTLSVLVDVNGSEDPWDEMPSLIHSDDSSEAGDHFVVETDENRRSLVRFGNGRNGRELPDGAIVKCVYQTGLPLDGNVGRDRIRSFDPASVVAARNNPADPPPQPIVLRSCRNPFDVIDGIDREPAYEIIRRAPESYRQRQLRAVTLGDYVSRAEEIEGVSRAAAAYMWTGSWRTVRVTIDPEGTTELSYELRKRVADYLEAVRLIGEDLEIRPPVFVPLDITVVLCAARDVWREDLRFVLEQEFSTGWTADGRRGFFHPDEWTFGRQLYASQIIGRALAVPGVEHAVEQNAVVGAPTIAVAIKRRNSSDPPAESMTNLAPSEIIMVANDPDHLELGSIRFDIKGGRQ